MKIKNILSVLVLLTATLFNSNLNAACNSKDGTRGLTLDPDWTPYEKTHNVERNNPISLSASNVNPDIVGVEYEWIVDGEIINGETGSSYSFSSGSTGTHTVSCKVSGATTDGDSTSCETSNTWTVYVNDNLNSPPNVIFSMDNNWAHHATETLSVTVVCQDYDWKDGVLDKNINDIDEANCYWIYDESVGQCIPESGEGCFDMNWCPIEGVYRQTELAFNAVDKGDIYNDLDVNKGPEGQVGSFRIVGKLGTTGDSALTMGDNDEGTRSVNHDSYVYTSESVTSPYPSGDTRIGQGEDTDQVNATWFWVTEPAQAECNGNVYLTIRANCSAVGSLKVLDTDLIDGEATLNLDVGHAFDWIGLSLKIGFPVAEWSVIFDDAEGVAMGVAAFKSDCSVLGNSLECPKLLTHESCNGASDAVVPAQWDAKEFEFLHDSTKKRVLLPEDSPINSCFSLGATSEVHAENRAIAGAEVYIDMNAHFELYDVEYESLKK